MILGVLLMASLMAAAATAEECGPCDPSKCALATECYSGVVMDMCNCCAVCGKREGEECDDEQLQGGNIIRGNGRCGESLECRIVKEDKKKVAMCVCKDQEMVCGSDGVTYSNLCQLMEAAYKNGTEQAPKVHMWGPCETEPVIVNGPKNAHEQLGNKIVMDCEVRGFPIPEVSWEKTGEDGRTISLPGDYQDMAIQTRGGPEKLMVTGWVQIINVQPTDSGVYTCIAKNGKGEARASAEVGVYGATKGEL